MSHSKIRARLNDYVDRELPGTQRAEVKAHLDGCPECALEVSELERTVALLRRLPEPALPPAFAATVMERVRAGEAEPASLLRALQRLLQPTLTVAATAAVAGVAVFVLVRDDATGPELEGGQEFTFEAPAPEPRRMAPPTPVPPTDRQLASTSPPTSGLVGERIAQQMRRHRRALQLARQGHAEEVARTVRGAGHPHSKFLAAHFEERRAPETIQLIVASEPPRRVARR